MALATRAACSGAAQQFIVRVAPDGWPEGAWTSLRPFGALARRLWEASSLPARARGCHTGELLFGLAQPLPPALRFCSFDQLAAGLASGPAAVKPQIVVRAASSTCRS